MLPIPSEQAALFIDFNYAKAEGFLLRVGAKFYTIAGPVILYGVTASVVYGLIYWIWTMFAGG